MTQIGEPLAKGLVPDYSPDALPWETYDEAFQFVDVTGQPVGKVHYEILRSDGQRSAGTTDASSRIPRLSDPHPLVLRIRFLGIAR